MKEYELVSDEISGTENEGNNGNREYKDSLFCFIFGHECRRHFTLELYNAVNGTNYTDPNEISFTTLENVLYIKVKNDISFLVSGKMNFYEHQSSFNPNMPVRMLIYSATVYDKYIKRNKLNVYGTAQLELPAPRFACFYNGTKAMKDKIVLKLSDSFENESRPDINLKVTMYNINHGQNKKLMNACRPLKDYAEFVNYVREYSESPDDLAESISKAIDSLPDDSVIKPVLEESRAEVINLCITEYTQEYADKIQKKEIDEYKETISVLKDDNANLRNDNANLQNDNANLRNDNVSLKSENDCLKNDIIEKDTEIATLKALLASKQIKH